MNNTDFVKWIQSEARKALRLYDLRKFRILMIWYEIKFKEEFNSTGFVYPFTPHLIAYHMLSKSRSWLDALIDEELRVTYVRDNVAFHTLESMDSDAWSSSYIAVDLDWYSSFTEEGILPNNLLSEIKGLLDSEEDSKIVDRLNSKISSYLFKIKKPKNLLDAIEEEPGNYDKIVVLSDSEFCNDLQFFFLLSSVKRRIDVYCSGLSKNLRMANITEMLSTFDLRYGVGSHADKGFFPYTLVGENLSVESPVLVNDPMINEAVSDIFSSELRGRYDSSVVVVFPRHDEHYQTKEPPIQVSDENMLKKRLMFSDEEINDDLLTCLSALNKGLHILVLGETGVGKSLIAQTFHQLSDRRKKPFIGVNCATLSKELQAAELFGAVPGAYTGIARDGLKGKIEAADGGTLFLDEIFEADPSIQSKLLTFLDDHTYMKVGGYQSEKADVRIIFATNRKIPEIVKHPDFREDFYHRISTFQVTIPPLRERQNDIIEVFSTCLKDISNMHDVPLLTVPPQTISTIKELRWSGNVRQMISSINRIVLYCHRKNQKIITPDLLLKTYKDIYSPEGIDNLEIQLIEFFNLWESKKDGFLHFLRSKGFSVDEEKGMNYLDGFIKPIIANFFIEKYDKNYSRKDVYKAIGMNAERQDSYLTLKAKLYPAIKEYFSK